MACFSLCAIFIFTSIAFPKEHNPVHSEAFFIQQNNAMIEKAKLKALEAQRSQPSEQVDEENTEEIETGIPEETTMINDYEESFSDLVAEDFPTAYASDDFTLLCQMVRIEIGEGSGNDYYTACYYQTAVALNRLNQGWGSSLYEVLMQEGQFYGYGYFTWDWSCININIPDLQQAVLDCLANNTTPSNMVFADSRHLHDGTDYMSFYTEICGQDFYLSY